MKNQFFTKALALSIMLCSAITITNAQAPVIKQSRTLGGSGSDIDGGLLYTGGQGFVTCGSTNSANGIFNVPANHGMDAFIVKYTSMNHIAWARTYGGSGDDHLQSIVKTSDGGFIASGQTSSNDGDITGNHGGDNDVWVVKFNSSGNIQWQKCFGGSGDDNSREIVKLPFGGYEFAATTNSNDGDVSGNHGDYDGWIVRISSTGNLISQKCFGGSNYDETTRIINSTSGSLIFSGTTSSNDGDVSGNHGLTDGWAVKINGANSIIWSKVIGGSGEEFQQLLVATKDGNIVIGGPSNSTDGDVSGDGLIDSWLAKLNPSNGNIIWSKSYAPPAERGAFGIIATKDGGTVEVGTHGVAGDGGSTWEVFISKWDANGNELWNAIYGGSDEDYAGAGFELPNGDINVLCHTLSSDGDVHNYHGNGDVWILQLGKSCNHKKVDAIANSEFVVSTYPNPISTSSTISFSLPQSQKVSLQIFDVNGKLIATLANGEFTEGEHQLEFNAEKLNAGIYFLKMQAGDVVKTEKLVVTK